MKILKFSLFLIFMIPTLGLAATNAQTVAPGDFRQTVALVYRNPTSSSLQGEIFCSGTLIGPATILTAGHCVVLGAAAFKVSQADFVSGLWIYIGDALESGFPMVQPTHKVAAATVNPLYTHDYINYDFAVLTLPAAVDLKAFGIQPAAILPSNEIKRGDQITSIGYGMLMNKGIKGYKTQFTLPVASKNNTWFTVGQNASGPTACHGDSGGSAYVQNSDGKRYLAGVTTRLSVDHCGYAASQYQSITPQVLAWINER